MDEKLSNQWFASLFQAEAMRGVFSDQGRLRGLLEFEAALATAESRAGIMPAAAAEAITSKCEPRYFDIAALSQASATTGNSAIAVIKELTRLVAGDNPAAANYVHWGATSQDAMDTGLVLQLREGLNLIGGDVRGLCRSLEKLAVDHKETPVTGRTWLQHAAPTTFGLKAAGWLCAFARHLQRLHELEPRVLVLQFGGATGTLAALGDQAAATGTFLAEQLRLRPAEIPWHAHRDRLVEVATTLGLLVGSLGKIARDISLMTQSEVAEVAEPSSPGRGGSTSMPQKSNPIGCAAVLAAATRVPALVSVMLAAMPQEHERGLGGWQAEWETLPEILLLTSGALAHIRQVAAGLRVYPDRMRANLDMTRGLIYAESVCTALGRKIGRAAAHRLVEEACRRAQDKRSPLLEVIAADVKITPHLSPVELKSLFDPQEHVRAAARLLDQSLAAAKASLSDSAKEGSSCHSPR